jgi:hypothetical protein
MQRSDLQRLPPDLMAMGWQLVSAREEHRPAAPTWYTVLCALPFERGIDDESLATYLGAYLSQLGGSAPGGDRMHGDADAKRKRGMGYPSDMRVSPARLREKGQHKPNLASMR